MIQIIRLTYHDDSDGSTSIDVMPCASIMSAKEIILIEINKGFEGDWKSLNEAATDLNDDLASCSWDEDNKAFSWYDNGKGETYIIGRINERELNTKWQKFWQNFGEIS